MKKLILVCMSCLFLFSCRQAEKVSDIIFREDIAYILDTIIASNPELNVCELYLDKIDPFNSNLLFYMGQTPLSLRQYSSTPALWHVKVGTKQVGVYSGVEKYIRQVSDSSLKKNRDFSKISHGMYWIIKERGEIDHSKSGLSPHFIQRMECYRVKESDFFVEYIMQEDSIFSW